MSGTDVLDLFPPGTHTDGDGTLVVGGCRLDDVAAEFGTPAMVVDEGALRRQARDYLNEFRSRRAGSDVAFASKSFPCTAIQRLMTEEGLHLDVAGGGEIVTALAAGADPARLVLHGNAKSDEELELAVHEGVGAGRRQLRRPTGPRHNRTSPLHATCVSEPALTAAKRTQIAARGLGVSPQRDAFLRSMSASAAASSARSAADVSHANLRFLTTFAGAPTAIE
ncbi:MAG: diaminopimelate decarboxylase [Mycobacterium sp.]|nr:diaminopimelate decarboxylase [Mycobacterium sp.]